MSYGGFISTELFLLSSLLFETSMLCNKRVCSIRGLLVLSSPAGREAAETK